MQKIHFDDSGMRQWVSQDLLYTYTTSVARAERMLQERSGEGKEFLGWLDLPVSITEKTIEIINEKASELREKSDILICIGIGGSYLGTKAVLEFCSSSFEDQRKPRVIFAGHHINSDYIHDLFQVIEGKRVSLIVISKSGTTTEPALAFRILRLWMERQYGRKEAASRIVAITDPKEGALRRFSQQQSYTIFDIPADVGGRYSVFSPVGLVPIAVAGLSINDLLWGGRHAMEFCHGESLQTNLSARYAVNRIIQLKQGKQIEMLATFNPHLHYIAEWWKQLSGESEGKDFSGLFPASADYTTDLHSLGQWMQQGPRSVFETFLQVNSIWNEVKIPETEEDGDELNYLKNVSLEEVNKHAFKGTLLAHSDGAVPVQVITIDERSEYCLGQLLYFFEKAIALSGYLMRVNPFNQPGVNAYKDNMFALLEKPGFEKRGEQLKTKLKELNL